MDLGRINIYLQMNSTNSTLPPHQDVDRITQDHLLKLLRDSSAATSTEAAFLDLNATLLSLRDRRVPVPRRRRTEEIPALPGKTSVSYPDAFAAPREGPGAGVVLSLAAMASFRWPGDAAPEEDGPERGEVRRKVGQILAETFSARIERYKEALATATGGEVGVVDARLLFVAVSQQEGTPAWSIEEKPVDEKPVEPDDVPERPGNTSAVDFDTPLPQVQGGIELAETESVLMSFALLMTGIFFLVVGGAAFLTTLDWGKCISKAPSAPSAAALTSTHAPASSPKCTLSPDLLSSIPEVSSSGELESQGDGASRCSSRSARTSTTVTTTTTANGEAKRKRRGGGGPVSTSLENIFHVFPFAGKLGGDAQDYILPQKEDDDEEDQEDFLFEESLADLNAYGIDRNMSFTDNQSVSSSEQNLEDINISKGKLKFSSNDKK
uniref:Transmembrane protein n=2 Tax=Corethron hystrix TaxID=216773 RepID=A0A7S1FZ13_9STRA|mmetsp:Transcript_39521/g.92360  ORF Transcript_39521/g.92360 Transcript_39521/m.92360 type:complete len:438 (+) Transcript_39521:357-1670(+)